MSPTYTFCAVNIFILLGFPGIQTAFHSIVSSYTQLYGSKQEFYALTEVDNQKVFYNDSKNKAFKPEWMPEMGWTQDNEKMLIISEKNILIMKDRLNAKEGMHLRTFQRTYGCKWHETNENVEAFDTYGYDGEDFISLDIQAKKYIAFSSQALSTRDMWNGDRKQLDFLLNYYKRDCVMSPKEMLKSIKPAFEKTVVSPKVSLLQKDPTAPVVCHVTDFYPRVNLTWLKNPSCNLEMKSEEVHINEDGTLQQSVGLVVSPEDWNRCIYYCQVTYNDMDNNIWKVVSKHDIEVKSNFESTHMKVIMKVICVAVVVVIALAVALAVYVHKRRKLGTAGCEYSHP